MRYLPEIFWAAALTLAYSGFGQTLLEVSSDPLLVRTLYQKPEQIVSGIAADGAIGVNADWEAAIFRQEAPERGWFIEEQRYGADLIQVGLATRDEKLIARGIKIINWGFAKEKTGSFPGTGDPHHSISFFLEAAARSAILLREAGDERHLAELRSWEKNIRNAAAALVTPAVFPANRSSTMDPYTHRFYLCAAALGEAGSVLHDEALMQAASTMATEGIRRQRPDGTNPEKGGFDVNYQAVGALFAIRYLLVCDDPSLSLKLRAMLAAAIDREREAIGPDGRVNTEGSTRLTSEESRGGRAKTMDYKTLAQTLVFLAGLSNNPSYSDTAAAIAKNKKW